MSLLLDALREAEAARDRARGLGPRMAPAPPSPPPPAPARKPSAGPFFALGLAVAIFLGAVSAWHAQPWRAPHKSRGDASNLKLDYRLDLDRKGVSPTERPGTPRP